MDATLNLLQQRNEAFRALLESLNPAQRRAVEQTEGPVLVIAGPGTGKTFVLAARIGKILLDTDARAQNILCLTFTEAGAHAMRQRLLAMIGPEAHRVPVYTFHAFCNRIIQENLEFFGRSELEPLTDLERIEIVRHLLDKLPPEHPLRKDRKDAYQFEAHLRDLFASMKKEGWTPGLVRKKADDYLAELPQNPDFLYKTNSKYGKKGEPKTEKIAEAQEKMERLRAAADLYPKYQNALERAGRYEYEDMLLWVLRAFERHPNLLRNYQERFQYFLVDEYQDTNGAQNRLLRKLLDYWQNPNVFIVGDDDQSIYEFQGARLQNLLDFYHEHRAELLTVVLEDNYRSPQDLLDTARRVIENNTMRAVNALDEPLPKILKAQTKDQHPPRLHVYENRLHEEADTVRQIDALLKAGETPGEIAVLYAQHRQASRLTTLLEKKGVPYQTKRPVNILELPLVQQFRELLRYLNDELNRPFSGEHRLFRLLHAPFFAQNPLHLAKIAAELRQSQDKGQAVSWRVFLNTEDGTSGQTGHAAFENWLTDAVNLPLPALLERLFTQSGLLNYVLAHPDKAWWLQVLNTLLDFAKADTVRNIRLRNTGSGLQRLLELLDSMDDNRLPLPVLQNIRPGDGVHLLTAHAAKGLEFKRVFLLDCTDEYWEPSLRSNNGRFALPDTLTLSGEEDAMEARRRLFYVALTRAKQQLTLSYSRLNTEGKPLAQARFVDETHLPKTECAVPLDTLLEAQTLLLLEPERPLVSLPEPALLEELLAQFTLSITSLNRFLRCPLAFYYEDVLQIPETMSEAAAYGQAMHGALQQFFLTMKAEKDAGLPAAEALVKLFVREMERQRGFFSTQAFAQRLALGKNYLQRYHVDQIPYWRRRAVVERRVDRAELDGVPLTGVLDKIEWLENDSLRIVDYKTGAPDVKKVAPPSENQPLGGDYWRQLAFYKILLESARMYAEPVSKGVIAWLEPDRKGIFPMHELQFSPEELNGMKTLIRDTYARIQARDFAEGCGQDDCPWCRMHRDRQWMDRPEREEENLDDPR